MAKPQIIIVVEGGNVQSVEFPPGVHVDVVVHDYDNGEGVDHDNLPEGYLKDADGGVCSEAIWESD